MEAWRGVAGVVCILLLAFLVSERRRAIRWRPVLGRHRVAGRARAAAAPVSRRRRACSSSSTMARTRLQRATDAGTALRVRLPRRTALSVHRHQSGGRLRARVQGAAAGADDQRARHAVVLSRHPPDRHARLRLGAAAHARHRRRALAGRGGAYLRRHDRGAAAGPAVARAHGTRRAVRADDAAAWRASRGR